MKIDFTFSLFEFTLCEAPRYIEFTFAALKNSQGRCRSLFAIGYGSDMCVALDIAYIHFVYTPLHLGQCKHVGPSHRSYKGG